MTDEYFEELCKKISSTNYIKSKDIPNIDLYMDQVTTFMEQQLASHRRYEQDKILTKTMINNYTKNKLLPPPEKKKYSKDHLILLTLIYYYKNFLSIDDIHTLLEPLSQQYFGDSDTEKSLDLTKIYETLFSYEPQQLEMVMKGIHETREMSKTAFADLPDDQRDELQQLTFVSQLSLDVYLKKMMIEQIIDDMKSKNQE
ncbi:MAG: DUF1836 domain-containing protein [Lachnospiraceae bacterium]